MKRFFILFLLAVPFLSYTQVVYEDINNVGIYDFLDELANLKVIEINSVVKPYSRQFIAGKLREAKEHVQGSRFKVQGAEKDVQGSRLKVQGPKKHYELNKRQLKELEFYWQDYQIDLQCQIPSTKFQAPNKFQNSSSKKKNVSEFQSLAPPSSASLRFRVSEDNDTLNLEPGTMNTDCFDSVSQLRSRTQNPELRTECCIEYDHKLGFLFKKKPSFAVPLNPLAFQFKNRVFTLSIRPILGYYYLFNENGSAFRRYWGGSFFGYIGRNFGFYASLRDNEESVAIAKPEYFTLVQGQVYKGKPGGGVYFSEMRGGITVSWNWGSIGLMNDRFEWGNNYHGSNILSGKAPSFPYIQLHIKPVKWLDFNYIHGWLNSNVIDSSRSYTTTNGDYRVVFRNKYIATNMFTISPFKRLNISFGNSIIYSDINVNPYYLIPFMFFNALDGTRVGYTDAASSNSQLFFDISSRQIKYLHLYVTLFIDELKMSRITNPNLYNFTSWKAGFRLSDFPLRNVFFTFEWTKTNPGAYQHYIPTTTYASNEYSMGHYLRDNSFEYYMALGSRPIRGLFIQASYTLAAHGDNYFYDHQGKPIDQQPYMKNKTWQNSEIAVYARYEYTANAYFFLEYLHSNREGDVLYQPEFLHGKTNTIAAGVNINF